MGPTRRNEHSQRGRGRPKKSVSSAAATPTQPSGRGKVVSKAEARRGRSSQQNAEPEPSKAVEKPSKPSQRKKRKVNETEADELDDSRPSKKPSQGRTRRRKDADVDELEDATAETESTRRYVHLAPKTKRIRQDVLQAWPEISLNVLEQISLLLKRAKNEIVYTRRDPRRADEAQDVLNATIRQLERSLSTMRIPPQAKALHFNLDRLAESNELVYREVTTARHAKQLLEEQVESTQRRLEDERKTMEDLRKNAQQWKGRWKSQEKKQLHPLLQELEDDETVNDRPADISLKMSSAPVDTAMLDAPDFELDPLIEQLRRNLETMQGNHAQVEGVGEAMRQAQVALDDLLFKHISARQDGT